MANLAPSIKKRKSLHLQYALHPEAENHTNGLENITLPFSPLPNKSLDQLNLSSKFLGKNINYPFFISCMTGGPLKAKIINKRLAQTAQKIKIPLGLGSMRIVLKYPELLPTFQIRQYAPDIPLMANLGAVSLNYGLTWRDCEKVVNLVDADALVLHLNPLQEALQSGGDTNFLDLLPKIEQVVKKLKVPVIVKEVGHGIDEATARSLYNSGINIIDTAGVGGTSWAWIEAKISQDERAAQLFKSYGINTYESILNCQKVKVITILGSGGIRTGIDIAKVLYMGCSLAGIARPFLLAALESEKALDKLSNALIKELKIATFCQP
jgi:isopentenyl-diphosphate delta-isomerase